MNVDSPCAFAIIYRKVRTRMLSLSLSLSFSLSIDQDFAIIGRHGATGRFPLSRRGAQLTSSIYSGTAAHTVFCLLLLLQRLEPLLIGGRTNAATAIDGRVFRARRKSCELSARIISHLDSSYRLIESAFQFQLSRYFRRSCRWMSKRDLVEARGR